MAEGSRRLLAHAGRWMPAVSTIRNYRRAWLYPDATAGLVLTALLVPQGMAYAELAGLPAVTGLYTTVAALVAYAVFGPSRMMVLGPDSSLAPLIAAAIIPLALAGTPTVAAASALSVLVGVICVIVGLARLGNITELLSRPARIGYINGIALIVLVSQLPKLFGFSTEATSVFRRLQEFVDGLLDGRVHGIATALGVGSLALIYGARRISPKLPGVLLATLAAISAVSAFGLADHDVPLVGTLPTGFPAISLPDLGWGDALTLTFAALGVALVAFADTAALSTTFASQLGEDVDPNQEVVALGVANLAAGLTSGFPMSASSSRTSVAYAIGARTQLTGIVGALGVLVLLLWGSNVLENLPSATLAAIVIVASMSLFDAGALRILFQIRRSEFFLASAALLGVLVIGVLEGIALAVGLSLANFIRRAWRPYDAVLGRIRGVRGYHDIERHPEASLIPGLVVFRFDAPLFFANALHFQRRLAMAVARSPSPVRWVIVAAEPITDIDTTASEVLTEILDEFEARGITLAFAELKGPVKDRLRSYGLGERIGTSHFYPTLGTATTAYVAQTGVEWVDWTDR